MTTATPPNHSKLLHIVLWVVQIVLGLMFVSAGVMKATQPVAALAERMVWPGVVPEPLLRFIGVSEFLGGLGLILPAATRIKPVLTTFAGAGLATIMLLAIGFHAMHSELHALPINLVLGGLATFVAWGRWKKVPIAGR